MELAEVRRTLLKSPSASATSPVNNQQQQQLQSPMSSCSSPSYFAPPPPMLTQPHPEAVSLWGMWEMWCDFPTSAPAASSSSKGAHHALTLPGQNCWLDSVKSVGVFDTAAGFWGIVDCLVEPSRLPVGANYYLFRYNIPPMWEHEANRRGGKWVAAFSPDQHKEADACWVDLCVAAIGEQVPGEEEEVCGVCVSRRRNGFKISLWTRNASNKSAQTSIGFYMKVLLNIGRPTSAVQGTLKYTQHQTGGFSGNSPTNQCGNSPTSSDARSPSPPMYSLQDSAVKENSGSAFRNASSKKTFPKMPIPMLTPPHSGNAFDALYTI